MHEIIQNAKDQQEFLIYEESIQVSDDIVKFSTQA